MDFLSFFPSLNPSWYIQEQMRRRLIEESLPPPPPPTPPFVPEDPPAALPPPQPELPLPPPPTPGQAPRRRVSPETLPLPPPPTPNSADAVASPVQKPDANMGRQKFADTLSDRLAAFGFAMAASRNPSLFGQIGEAGQAVLQQRREEQLDDLRRRQAESESAYRAARAEVLRAELEWSRDPTNPQNIERLARARSLLAQAANERDPIIAREVDQDGNVFGVTRSGRAVALTDPQGRPFQPARDESQNAQARRTLYATIFTQVLRELNELGNPMGAGLSPNERRQLAASIARQAVEEAMQTVGVRRGQEPPRDESPPRSPRPVIDTLGRRIE